MPVPPLEILSRQDLDKLHADTLTVLEQTGVEVHDAAARDLLAGAGAKLDGARVRLGADLVAQALSSAPKEAMVYTRDGRPAMRLAPGETYFGTGSDVTWIIDPESGERRDTTLDTIRLTTRLTDALPNLDFAMSMGRARGGLPDQEAFAGMVESTTKPVSFTAQAEQAISDIAAMCAVVAGGVEAFRATPFAILYAMPTSPLMHSEEALATVRVAAQAGIPTIYSAAPMLGATGPITPAGALIVGNAEMLSGLVIQQLYQPGAVFIHGPILGPLDMRTMVNAYCGPETMLLSIAEAQLGRYYELPIFGLAGASDSKLFDQQAAGEAASALWVTALAGATFIHDVGYLESGLCASPDLMVFCDEVIEQIRYVLGGMEVSDSANLLGDIAEVGPAGNFLAQPSTLERFREVIWNPRLTDRTRYDDWRRTGAGDMATRVRARVKHLLASHQPLPLEPSVRTELWRLAGA